MSNLTPLAMRLAAAHADGGWEAVAGVVEGMVAEAVAQRYEYMERIDAAAAMVVASGHILGDSILIVAALENSDVRLVRERVDAGKVPEA